jgi:hypothetical protein
MYIYGGGMYGSKLTEKFKNLLKDLSVYPYSLVYPCSSVYFIPLSPVIY